MKVSKHAYNRIYERVYPVCSMKEAKKLAKEAYEKGYSLEQLKPEYKHLARYMTYKLKNESERTEIRMYKECLWLWNGRKKILRTVYPIYKSIPVSMDLKKMRKREKENGCHDQSTRAL